MHVAQKLVYLIGPYFHRSLYFRSVLVRVNLNPKHQMKLFFSVMAKSKVALHVVSFIGQMTFFGACLALMGRRESLDRHAITCLPIVSRSQAGR